MIILAIDTSCDETSVAITEGRRVLSNVVYSQVLLHKQWGGVVPSIAKRAHEERINLVVLEALKKYSRLINSDLQTSELASRRKSGPVVPHSSSESEESFRDFLVHTHTRIANRIDFVLNHKIDAIAVTQGPGLAIALGVGIQRAKELAAVYNKKFIAVNHLEGHLYSPLVENRNGNPRRMVEYPFLGLVISGGHTDIVKVTGDLTYEVLGATVDDAAGEALDKAAKMLGLGYPGGAVIERLAKEVGNGDTIPFPRPMLSSGDLQFSFSGLKTSLYYYLQRIDAEKQQKMIKELASSYQEAVFDTLIKKTHKAIITTGITRVLVGGGVIANAHLRSKFRALVKKHKGSVLFPPYPYLTGDNAAMIGIVAGLRAHKGLFSDPSTIDRIPRMHL